MAGSLTISGMSSGEPAGERIFGPITTVGKAVIGETIVTPMAAGANVFSVPTESVAVMIVPPLGNEATLKLRTSANPSDVGLSICESANPTVVAFPVGVTPTSITLTANLATTNAVSITFI
jgi:hypothetical protein